MRQLFTDFDILASAGPERATLGVASGATRVYHSSMDIVRGKRLERSDH